MFTKKHNFAIAFQKRRFCTVKAAVLHRKTYAFALQNNRFRNAFVNI